MTHFSRQLLLFMIVALTCQHSNASIITTLNFNDPVPVQTTRNPYDYMLSCGKDDRRRGLYPENQSRFSFTATPFYQRASRGKGLAGEPVANLGSLRGDLNMIAVLPFNAGGDIPTGKTVNPYLNDIRTSLLSCIFDVFDKDPTAPSQAPGDLTTVEGLLATQETTGQIGFFSIPIVYRKRGIRFQAQGLFSDSFGFCINTGFASIEQRVQFVDQTQETACVTVACTDTQEERLKAPNPFTYSPVLESSIPGGAVTKTTDDQWRGVLSCISNNLMSRLGDVARATDTNLCSGTHTGMEDLYGELFWRRAFRINRNQDECDYSRFLLIPFATVGGALGIDNHCNPHDGRHELFALPFGNNGHNSFSFRAGALMDFDRTVFREALEVGFDVGFTHFSGKKYDAMPIPTNDFQNVIFPYTANTYVRPGNTWHGGLLLNSHHFCNQMSLYAHYLYVSHQQDTITVLDNDPEGIFKADTLECLTSWSAQYINLGLNFDISPCAVLGGLWQIPVTQRNAYRSTTYALTFEASF